MADTSSTPYIVAIPGSEEPRELTREDLLAELNRGTINSDYWVWSPADSDWKQISEFPELKPAPVIPVKVPTPVVTPKVLAPIAAAVPVAAATPIRAPKAPKASRKKAATAYRVPEENLGLRLAIGAVYLLLLAVIALNYFLVDEPLDAAMARTPFVLVPVQAHLGQFVRPGNLVIHILPNQELTAENLPNLFYTLAKNTPDSPIGHKPFDQVTLTSSWFGQYALRQPDWQQLGAMSGASSEARKTFFLEHLITPAGQPLMAQSDDKAARTQLWQDVCAKFLSKS